MVTVSRSDYGIYLPVLRQLRDASDVRLQLFVTGMHLCARFGSTVELIERDGFPIVERIATLSASDTPAAIASAIGAGVCGFSSAFSRHRPDILVVLGDRFDMYPAVVAALPYKIPVAHVHGGELTEGAIDDALRHSMTKLSHLHFVSTDVYARRVAQLGEERWRITVCGAPSLDNLKQVQLLSAAELEASCGLCLSTPPLLVTFHPVTLEYEHTDRQILELLAALERSGRPVVFTLPNADTGGATIIRRITEYVDNHDSARLVANLGTERYFSLMSHAAAMVGNSSSGIIEAASLGLPVVNVGSRQRGRAKGINVLDVECEREAILQGIRTATSQAFRDRMTGLVNPYGQGNAAPTIVATLKTVALDDRLLVKKFVDQPHG